MARTSPTAALLVTSAGPAIAKQQACFSHVRGSALNGRQRTARVSSTARCCLNQQRLKSEVLMFSFLYPGAMAMRAMITDQPVKIAPRQ